MAELGLTRGVAAGTVGEGLEDGARSSLGDESEAMERGQDMERLIGPESVGETEAAGLVLSDLIGGFQCMRPAETQKRGIVSGRRGGGKAGRGGGQRHTVTFQFLFFPDPVSVLRSLSSSLLCFPSVAWWL